MRLDRGDLLYQLQLKVNSLIRSSLSYDKGDYTSAIDMSTNIRVLVHDTNNSSSLLAQLNKKEEMAFLDSSENITQHYNTLPQFTLVRQTVNSQIGIQYQPLIDNSLLDELVDFNSWWEENVVIIPKKNIEISRKTLVLKLANKYGAHISTEIPEYYHDLFQSKDEMIGFTWRKNMKRIDHIQTPIFPSIRQIAHELIVSIDKEFEEINLPQSYLDLVKEEKKAILGFSGLAIGLMVKSESLKKYEKLSQQEKNDREIILSKNFFHQFKEWYPSYEFKNDDLIKLLNDLKPYGFSEKILLKYCKKFQPHFENYKRDIELKLNDNFRSNAIGVIRTIIWMNNDDFFIDNDPPHQYQVLRKKYNQLLNNP